MSKKKKKKKYYQQVANNVSNTASDMTSSVNNMAGSVATSVSGVIASAVTPMTPAKPTVVDKLTPVYNAHAEEYRTVRSDLIRVAVVNGIFLLAVFALYYANRSNPFLEAWYQKLF